MDDKFYDDIWLELMNTDTVDQHIMEKISNRYKVRIVIINILDNIVEINTQYSYEIVIHALDRMIFCEHLLTCEDTISLREVHEDDFMYEENYEMFRGYTGTTYNASLFVISSCLTQPIEHMQLREYLVCLFRKMWTGVIVLLYREKYYVFGHKYFKNITLVKLENNGVFSIPKLTINQLMEKYQQGNIRDLILNCPDQTLF